jgi:hypothetical protein
MRKAFRQRGQDGSSGYSRSRTNQTFGRVVPAEGSIIQLVGVVRRYSKQPALWKTAQEAGHTGSFRSA